jgi:hypothetical protein
LRRRNAHHPASPVKPATSSTITQKPVFDPVDIGAGATHDLHQQVGLVAHQMNQQFSRRPEYLTLADRRAMTMIR